MAITKANSDVISIPLLSTSLTTDSTLSGIKNQIDSRLSLLANMDSPVFTGTVTVPVVGAGDYTTKAASAAYVNTEIANNTFGISSKATGPKIVISTIGPSGGNNGDVWVVTLP